MTRRPPNLARPDVVATMIVSLCIGVMIVVLGRVVQLQAWPSERLKTKLDQHIRVESDIEPRGDLLDRRGRLLATSRLADRVVIDPTLFPADKTLPMAVSHLADALRMDPDLLLREIRSIHAQSIFRFTQDGRFLRYVRLTGAIEPEMADDVRELTFRGISLEPMPVREKLVDDSLAPVIGRLRADFTQPVGLERAVHEQLSPEPGSLTYINDGKGKRLWAVRERLNPAVIGLSIRTTIDLRLQQIMLEELRQGIADCDAAGGRAMMVDPATGEVYALVDLVAERDDLVDPLALPADDEHDETAAASEDASSDRIRYRMIPPIDAPVPAVRRMRLVHDTYEPGSIFKPFVWALLTSRGVVDINELFTVNYGRWRTPYGRPIRDVSDTRKELDWRDVLVRSSNIGMAQAVERIERDDLRQSLERFGFGQATGLQVAGERTGRLTPLNDWGDYSHTSVSFGQEIAVTSSQLVRAFCAFGGRGDAIGRVPTLTLIPQPAHASDSTATPPRLIEPWAAYQARDAMGQIAENVRRRIGQAFPDEPAMRFTSFGKTGTAQVAKPGGGGYFEKQYISSYLTAAPLNNPRVVLLVSIDDPGPERVDAELHYGSVTAAPVAMRILNRTLAYLGEMPDLESSASTLARQ